jgi:RNase P subunit RPR2
MTITETVIGVLAIAVIVLSFLVVVHLTEQRSTRKFAARVVGSVCPHCGEVFGSQIIQTAREEGGFDLKGRYVSVICPGCAKRWRYFEGALTEIPI